ncbi:TetR family transcriptional regulator [Phreatobacter stygius]|uniref:TetR family transcriptional regulator n=1 Tax=Phreatobacter stygius TaxID=1940610 RepID=A0A4D7B6P2_9HYPH|nr:TetR family transcriptional regulator [Phreatobacter stygius]QCI65910.1 TetR family transcriptional regulator [Phreatobacter stygius]
MRRTKADAGETRQSIMDAAERLFFANGVADTSLEQIAAEAGVTRGAIYWYFANKTELFLAMHDSVPLLWEEVIARAVVEGHPDPLTLLENIALDSLQLLASDERRQRIYRIMTRCEYQGDMARVLDRQQEAMTRQRSLFIAAFKLASQKGQLSASWHPETAARTFDWLFCGMVMEWLHFDQHFDLVACGATSIRRLFAEFRTTVAREVATA